MGKFCWAFSFVKEEVCLHGFLFLFLPFLRAGEVGIYNSQKPFCSSVTFQKLELCNTNDLLFFLLGADDFFDPAADASSMNTFTKRDHVFAKLNLQLQGGSFTLLHKEKKVARAEESAFMQLEFSGIESISLCSFSKKRSFVCLVTFLWLLFLIH